MRAGIAVLAFAQLACAPASALDSEIRSFPGRGGGPLIEEHRIEAGRPVRVRTHGRVTTTVVFPAAIGVPDGAGFTEDPKVHAGEFRISWEPGAAHFSVVPLKPGAGRNLNVPLGGEIVVLVFEPADAPEQAAALVRLHAPATHPGEAHEAQPAMRRSPEPPERLQKPASPERLRGLIDRMKLVHAAGLSSQVLARLRGVSWAFPEAIEEGPGWKAQVLLALRDERLDAVGFALLVFNEGGEPLVPVPGILKVHVGEFSLEPKVVEVPERVPGGEARPVYLVVQAERPAHLAAANPWRFTLAFEETETAKGGVR